MKDSKGRFMKGHKMSEEEAEKKRISLIKMWERRGNNANIKLQYPHIFNSWRGILYSSKNYPVCDEWKDFKTFFDDVFPTYKKGLKLFRLDLSFPYSKTNFVWSTDKQMKMYRSPKIEYNGLCLYLFEWAEKYNLSYTGIKQRYYKSKKLSNKEIIFGQKRKTSKKKITDYRDLISKQSIRNKVSKMISAYKCKDKRKNFECDIDREFMENIITSQCVYCGSFDNVGCDRINNNKGHTKDNVVPCCYRCNVTRGNQYTFWEMLLLGKAIRNIDKMRKTY